MKNYALIKYDKSNSLLYRLCHKDECFQYAVVYTDGTISYLKSLTDKKEAWGIVFKGYVVSITSRRMSPIQVDEFCKNSIFLGKNCCILPLNIMEKIIKNVHSFNEILNELNGTLLDAHWYMAKNDRWVDENFAYDPRFCVINPQVKNNCREAIFISENDEGIFYPAVKL